MLKKTSKGKTWINLQKPLFKGLTTSEANGNYRNIVGALLVMCFYVSFLLLFYGFLGGMNKKFPWALVVWMMVSFASVTGCRIDEHRPKLSVLKK